MKNLIAVSLLCLSGLAQAAPLNAENSGSLDGVAGGSSFPVQRRHLQNLESKTTEVVMTAMAKLDIPYKLGGASRESGFDCSGLVHAVFKQTLGLVLPRRAVEQAASTEQIEKSQLRPGDLVFFNTLRRSFSHVGIYIGDNKFIHAPRTGARVRVENMDMQYWRSRFDGARRVSLADSSGEMPRLRSAFASSAPTTPSSSYQLTSAPGMDSVGSYAVPDEIALIASKELGSSAGAQVTGAGLASSRQLPSDNRGDLRVAALQSTPSLALVASNDTARSKQLSSSTNSVVGTSTVKAPVTEKMTRDSAKKKTAVEQPRLKSDSRQKDASSRKASTRGNQPKAAQVKGGKPEKSAAANQPKATAKSRKS